MRYHCTRQQLVLLPESRLTYHRITHHILIYQEFDHKRTMKCKDYFGVVQSGELCKDWPSQTAEQRPNVCI